jgi:hypothetical protein
MGGIDMSQFKASKPIPTVPRKIKCLVPVTRKEPGRYELNKIRVENKDGIVRATATNEYVLGIYEHRSVPDARDYPAQGNAIYRAWDTVYVLADDLKEIKKPKIGPPIVLKSLGIVCRGDIIGTDLESTHTIKGAESTGWPDIDKVIPKTFGGQKFKMSLPVLEGICKVMREFLGIRSAERDIFVPIQFELQKDGTAALRVSVEEGDESIVLIAMPMRTP